MNAPHDVMPGGARLSRRAEALGTENAFVVLAEVNALVRQGRDIVSFCIGQPDFATPSNVQVAAIWSSSVPISTGRFARSFCGSNGLVTIPSIGARTFNCSICSSRIDSCSMALLSLISCSACSPMFCCRSSVRDARGSCAWRNRRRSCAEC